MKERYKFIDVAKGIGIILVVWFHIPNILSIETVCGFQWGGYITTFYMPLFFLLSGMFFTQKIKKRAVRLLVPYFFLKLIGAGVFALGYLMRDHYVPVGNETFFAMIWSPTKSFSNAPCWFLLSLFEIDIMFYILVKFLKNKHVILLLSIALSIVGYMWENDFMI